MTTSARLVRKGCPPKVVLGIFQKPTLAIYFSTAGKIKKPADLKGSRISMCPPDGMAQYVPAYLEAVQLKTSDVEFVTVDCSVKYTVVAQGKADAVASYLTAGKPLLAAVGIANSSEFDYADAGIFLPSHGIVASAKTIQDNPKLIERFNTATVKSWAAAKQDPDASIAAFVAANPLQKGRETVLKEALVSSFSYLSTPGTAGKPFGWQSPEEWEKAKSRIDEVREHADLRLSRQLLHQRLRAEIARTLRVTAQARLPASYVDSWEPSRMTSISVQSVGMR